MGRSPLPYSSKFRKAGTFGCGNFRLACAKTLIRMLILFSANLGSQSVQEFSIISNARAKAQTLPCTSTGVDRVNPMGRADLRTRLASRGRAGISLSVGTLLIILVLSLVYAARGQSGSTQPSSQAASATSESGGQGTGDAEEPSVISRLFGPGSLTVGEPAPEGWGIRVVRMFMRLMVAALLAAMLAYRPYTRDRFGQRNPYVAETQILLAVVASALMMIVADNTARAFGIFAAASLVRFRTNIRDPKEITVLLINLAIGLAAGVGRFELAVVLSLFVLATLWVLERVESRQVVRSMELKVKTHNVTATDEVLRKIFDKYKLTAELRQIDREDEENPLGRIVYYVTVGSRLNTDRLSEEIFSADPRNVDTLEWHQKKSTSYLYR